MLTLPRLRVRELMFLVVYAALIGQAFLLSIPATARPVPPSKDQGYVWVNSVDAVQLEIFSRQADIRAIAFGTDGKIVVQEAFGVSISFQGMNATYGQPFDDVYYLVPKYLVK